MRWREKGSSLDLRARREGRRKKETDIRLGVILNFLKKQTQMLHLQAEGRKIEKIHFF